MLFDLNDILVEYHERKENLSFATIKPINFRYYKMYIWRLQRDTS